MLLIRRKMRIRTERLILRPPAHGDFQEWAALRRSSAEHLTRWEPAWASDHFSRKAFTSRVLAMVHFAFTKLDLSRVEAACLPENAASRGLLEASSFKYEGVAQSYLQINGRWRNHVLYACLRGDRRGKVNSHT
jgi:RimJ/RimL family protein N-acetyltransferase